MKRINLILLIILIMSGAIGNIFASSKNSNNFLFSDYYNYKEESKLKYSFMDDTYVELNYKQSRIIGNNDKELKIYTDKDDSTYFFDENKNIGILFTNKIKNNRKNVEKSDIKDIEKSANKFFNKIIKEKNNYKYDSYKYNEHLEYYSFLWVKYINNIKTIDFVQIDLNNKGEILSFSQPNQGLFKDEKVLIEKSKEYIAKNEAMIIVEDYITVSGDNSKITSYNVKNANLYFDENETLVWEFEIILNYDNTASAVSIKVDANSKEIIN